MEMGSFITVMEIMQGNILSKNRGSEGIIGGMDQFMRVTGMKIMFRDLELTNGLMVACIKGNGKIIIWKELDFIHGLMEGNIQGNIRIIVNMVMEYINQLKVIFTQDIGKMEKETGQVAIYSTNKMKLLFGMASGNMENKLNGSIKRTQAIFKQVKLIFINILKMKKIKTCLPHTCLIDHLILIKD